MVNFTLHIDLTLVVGGRFWLYLPNYILNVSSSDGQMGDVVGVLDRFSNQVVIILFPEQMEEHEEVPVPVPLRVGLQVFISQAAVFRRNLELYLGMGNLWMPMLIQVLIVYGFTRNFWGNIDHTLHFMHKIVLSMLVDIELFGGRLVH